MSKLPIIKAKELIGILNRLGFFKFHQVGSHAQFKPTHQGKDMGKKTLKGIIDDLDFTVEEFIKI